MADLRMQRTAIVPGDWVLGSYDAPVTILEYGDLECPYCAAVRPVLEELVAADPARTRLVFRHFPVTTLHAHARLAAESAEAAGAQGRFWEMHDMIFTHQDQLQEEHLRAFARAVGVSDTARFDRELRTGVYRAEVRDDFRRGVEDGVNGTPTLYINRRRYDGPRDRESLLRAIAALRDTAGVG
ncbi:MAG: DsbA family protein [Longimicrobiales bacterium]